MKYFVYCFLLLGSLSTSTLHASTVAPDPLFEKAQKCYLAFEKRVEPGYTIKNIACGLATVYRGHQVPVRKSEQRIFFGEGTNTHVLLLRYFYFTDETHTIHIISLDGAYR